MEAVVLLIILCIVSTLLSVWVASSFRTYRKLVDSMSKSIEQLQTVVSSLLSTSAGGAVQSSPTVPPVPAIPAVPADTSLTDAMDVLNGASDEDLAAAAEIIKKLGLS